MKARKAYTPKELEELDSLNAPLIQEEVETNVRIHACDVECGMWPQYDFFDTRTSTVLALALPGYDMKRLNVELLEGTLTISAYDSVGGNCSSSVGVLEMKRHGIHSGAFARVFDVDPDCEVGRVWKEDGMVFVELVKG